MDTQELHFGNDVRNAFMMDPNSVFLNHASYGTIPRCVHERQIRYLSELENHPDKWFRCNMYKYLNEAIETVSEFIGVEPVDTFLMQNATKATNTVLKAFPLTVNDAILVTNWTYEAVAVTARVTADRANDISKVHVLELSFPISDEKDIVRQYDRFLTEHPDVKITVIDHITSPSTVSMPIKQLTELCHRHNVIVLIDGAQAPGQLPLDLPDYDADFYTGNLHKWVYCPRSCAFLWKNPKRNHGWLRPLVTSAFEKDGLSKAFAYEGTKDDTPYICAAEGIKFYTKLGGREKITNYTNKLKKQAIEYLEQKWNTKRLKVPPSVVPPNMEIIRLPYIDGYSNKPELFLDLQTLIGDKFDVQTFVVNIRGELCMRLSIQVYNTMDDVIKLGDAILKLHSLPMKNQ